MLPDLSGIHNKALPGTHRWETQNSGIKDKQTYNNPNEFHAPQIQYARAPNYPSENYGPTVISRIVIVVSFDQIIFWNRCIMSTAIDSFINKWIHGHR